jgi:hypothetical protein
LIGLTNSFQLCNGSIPCSVLDIYILESEPEASSEGWTSCSTWNGNLVSIPRNNICTPRLTLQFQPVQWSHPSSKPSRAVFLQPRTANQRQQQCITTAGCTLKHTWWW